MGLVKLGLPLEYKKFPEYFDAHNVGDDTEAKNHIVESLLRKHQVQSVLDMTCGTGSQVFYLAKRGYKVVGSDFSPALLNIARTKATDISFVDGDMRTLKVGKFDAVITMFNAVGHLTKAGFEKAMANIRKNLKDGGIYIFDIFNLQAMTDQTVDGLVMDFHRLVGGVKLHNTQHSTLDREKGLLTSYDVLTVHRERYKPCVIKNKFTLQIYTAMQLRDMLARQGFETLDQYGMDGGDFIPEKTLSILTMARKI